MTKVEHLMTSDLRFASFRGWLQLVMVPRFALRSAASRGHLQQARRNIRRSKGLCPVAPFLLRGS